jgi:tryptophan synthase alpha chain
MTQAPSGLARISEAFAAARAAGRGALIPYLCAGDPDLRTTERMLGALGRAGADIIEVGIPYGDPLADGPTIAASAQRALDAGTTLEGVLETMGRAERAGAPPLIAFTYVNLVAQYGVERFADGLVAAGAAGAIVPDIPLEETAELRALFAARGLALPLLVAPTTPAARAEEIARASEGFVYIVSRLGVTGAKREPDFSWIANRVASLRRATSQPLAVGFGISSAEHVRRSWEVADGAIVGSALIDAYANRPAGEAVERAGAFVATLAGEPRTR